LPWALLMACIALSNVSAVHVLAAQDYPNRPMKIIVPFPTGGAPDVLMRMVGQKLSEKWGQGVVIENRAGAGGNVGAEIVYRAEPDGYTLLCSPPGPLSINHNLYKTLPYDWTRFVPIGVLALVPNVITARIDLPASSLPEFIAWAKANPGKATYASQGNGSTSHLTAAMFMRETGTDMIHVPYKGTAPALADLLGGQVDLMFDAVPTMVEYIKGAKVKAIATTGKARSAVLPDVPTVDESGVPKYEATIWLGLLAPKGTNGAVLGKLRSACGAAAKKPEFAEAMKKQGTLVHYLGAKAYTDFLKQNDKLNKDLAKELGMLKR